MARFLRDLLDAEEPLFSQSIAQLEKISGHIGADVRLISDITRLAHENMRRLNLDPAVATGKEVYQALQNRLHSDVKRLVKVIGASDVDDVEHLVPFMVKAAQEVEFNRSVFVLKHEKAKEYMRAMPPKKLMKQLGYDDIDVMLQREDLEVIYTALRFSEGPKWLDEFNQQFESVRPSDFERRKLRIVQMAPIYRDLAQKFVEMKQHNVVHSKEMGVIAVVPIHQKRVRGIVLKTLPVILHYMNEIKMYTTFFKLRSTKSHFGTTVAETLIADPATKTQLAGNTIHWRVIQRHLGKRTDTTIGKEVFRPHLEPEDLHWRRAEEMLFDIDPELEFWKGRDYVARVYDGFPVSFNLFDVSFAYANEEPYENRYAYHFRESLWNELFTRYMGSKNLEAQIINDLDNAIVAPEKLSPPKLPGHVKEKLSETRRRLEERKKMLEQAEGRLKNVTHEFTKVFDVLEKYDKTVTVFGSARLRQDDPASVLEYNIALKLAAEGYAIVTGGGHGIMEAANRGAFDGGADSVGFNIILPSEQTLNQYTTDSFEFGHFFGRKVAMTIDAEAYIFMPGGFGTFDELFEILTLIQTRRMPRVPVILVDTKFWKPFDRVIRRIMVEKYHTAHADDLNLYKILDNPDDVIRVINYHYSRSKLANKALE